MAREVRLWEWLRDGLQGTEALHLCRVENSAGVGTPDVEGCCAGTAFQMELKGCERGRDGRLVNLHIRREQALWLRRRRMCGGRAFLAVRVGVGRGVARYLLDGRLALWLLDSCDVVYETDLSSRAYAGPGGTPGEFLRAACSAELLPVTE